MKTRQSGPAPNPLLSFLVLGAVVVHGQFVRNSDQYREQLESEEEALLNELKSHPDLESKYFPNKYSIPIDFYRLGTQSGFSQNVIFDPCRGFEYDCCKDTYGTPEFHTLITDPESERFGEQVAFADTGEEISLETTRLADPALVIDEQCTGFLDPRDDCVATRVARNPFARLPRCWNHNDSVVADQSCRAPLDGSEIELCLEVGITQTAYIVECGGAFADDDHCGTFLEVHRPGSTRILSETRLKGQYTSGYRMTVLSMTFQGNSSRVLCQGQHELWWVQRTRYDWIVERILPFAIISPQCDWDEVQNTFREYATVGDTEQLTGLDPYDPSRFLFSRPRTIGLPGSPGVGMGGTADLPRGGEFPDTARFVHGDRYTYTYTPDRPDLSVRKGELWEGHPYT